MKPIEFIEPHETKGCLEMIEGGRVGIRLPFHDGVTFIGRTEDRCEYKDREQLSGVVEAAQVYVRFEYGRCEVTDATSTNQSYIVRCDHEVDAGAVLRDECEYAIELQYEPLDVAPEDRRWTELQPGDSLVHLYGVFRFDF